MSALASLSGRKLPNRSRKLLMMGEFGLIALANDVWQTSPTALANKSFNDAALKMLK